jgi:hypothetical protein
MVPLVSTDLLYGGEGCGRYYSIRTEVVKRRHYLPVGFVVPQEVS